MAAATLAGPASKTKAARKTTRRKPASAVATSARTVVLLKAFFTAIDVLNLNLHDAAAVLATSEKSIRRYRTAQGSPDLNRDQVDRIVLVIGIYESLRDIFSGNPLAIEWLRRPNKDFGGQRPLDRLRAGSMRDLADVQRYLVAHNGGVW